MPQRGGEPLLVHVPESDGSLRIERHDAAGVTVVGWTFPLDPPRDPRDPPVAPDPDSGQTSPSA
jgi:hypothetical protein